VWNEVSGRFSDVPITVQIAIVRCVADHSLCVASETLLNQVYELFLNLPIGEADSSVQFRLVEATLYALFKLVRALPAVGSELIGTVLVQTGRGDEYDAEEMNVKRGVLVSRAEQIEGFSREFLRRCDARRAQLEVSGSEGESPVDSGSEDETKTEVQAIAMERLIGTNCALLCTALKGDADNGPLRMSWHRRQVRAMHRTSIPWFTK
jgi:hypothetical protein